MLKGLSLEYQIAKRYLSSKRKESFISFVAWFALVGIALGVAVLIIVMSVMNGFRKEIINNFIGTQGHVVVSSFDNKITNYEKIVSAINGTAGVVGISPTILEQGLLSYKNSSSGVLVYGLSYNDIMQRELLANNLKNIDLKDFKDGTKVVLLGRIVMRNLGVSVGDNITLISPNGYSTMFGSLPRVGSYKIIGVINTGMYQYDSSTAIMPRLEAQEFFFYDNAVQRIEIFLKDPLTPSALAKEISGRVDLNKYYVETWQDSNKQFINALVVERNVMFLILSLVILIAAFNIISGLVMLSRSKTKEIAILRAMGLSKKSVVTIFLLVGMRIGFIGVLSGAILGALFSYNIESIRAFIEFLIGMNLFSEEIYFLSQLPADVKSGQVIAIIVMALTFSILASIYPAIKASKVQPAEGLKYE